MQPVGVVLHPAPFCQQAGFTDGHEQLNVRHPADSLYKNSSPILLLNDSRNGFSHGEPGGMYSVRVQLPTHHSRRPRASARSRSIPHWSASGPLGGERCVKNPGSGWGQGAAAQGRELYARGQKLLSLGTAVVENPYLMGGQRLGVSEDCGVLLSANSGGFYRWK